MFNAGYTIPIFRLRNDLYYDFDSRGRDERYLSKSMKNHVYSGFVIFTSQKNISKLHIYYFELPTQTYLINIALRQISSSILFAGMLCEMFRDTFKRFIAIDKVFSFMDIVK